MSYVSFFKGILLVVGATVLSFLSAAYLRTLYIMFMWTSLPSTKFNWFYFIWHPWSMS